MKNAAKQTIKPSEIQIGDVVVGFPSPVAKTSVSPSPYGCEEFTTVTFADGQIWKTSDHFETTVMRS